MTGDLVIDVREPPPSSHLAISFDDHPPRADPSSAIVAATTAANATSFASAMPSGLDVAVVGVVTDVVPAGAHGGDRGGAGPHERIEHQIADVRVHVDQALGQRDGERRRMADAPARSGGISHTSTVASMNSSRLIVLTDGRPSLARSLGVDRTVEATLRGDDRRAR